MTIDAQTLLVLADGQKAIFFRNQGLNGRIRLKELQRFSMVNMSTHEMGWDRPGRVHARYGDHRSAYASADLHEVEEQRFLQDVAGAIEGEMADAGFKKLAIIAPARSLRPLREALPPEIASKVSFFADKDYLNTPLADLEEILMRGLQ